MNLQKKVRCVIVDDDELSRTIIKEFVSKTEFLLLAAECGSAIEAAEYLRNHEVEILLLDVEMPHMSGLELLESMKNPPAVILITAKENYAVEAFEYEVRDYIVKPVSYARFLKAVNKVAEQTEAVEKDALTKIFVKSDGKFVSIAFNDIQFIEAMGDYVNIITNKQKITVHATLTNLSGKLSSSHFIRIHRSYIINLEMINSIEDNTVIVNGRILPISANYRDALFQKLGI